VLAYAALGVVLVAPLVATPKLPGVTQIAEGRFDALQSAQVPPYVVCVNLAAVHIGHWSHLQKSWL